VRGLRVYPTQLCGYACCWKLNGERPSARFSISMERGKTMIQPQKSLVAIFLTLLSLLCVAACQPATNYNSNTSPLASPSPSASPSASPGLTSSVTLPVLDALFSDEAFKSKLKSSVQLTDEQLAQLQQAAADEVARLREANTEDGTAEQVRLAAQSRENADAAIRKVVGDEKAASLYAFVRDYWIRGGDDTMAGKTPEDNGMLPGPNAVPKDTRLVVNIPAYRMDVFSEGSLVKSYKVGIGYPDFPLPTGLRKAQSIIFNPTWTPPDEPWVAKMKGVAVGEKVAAGSKLNPLGPIKIPIGLPSLIHGGKSTAKLGTFASHGCVGLTTPQVQDFSKLLAQIAGTELSDKQLQTYFKDKTKTETVKLGEAVPVELRYETIVVEDGKLHIYRDIYDHDTNTEANLRAVLAASGVQFETLSEEEQGEILAALNAMAGRPQTSESKPKGTASPVAASEASPETAERKVAAARPKKPIGKNQKEVVIEIAALDGKGYPTAVNFDTGSGKPAATIAAAR
jgi:lipoprotein-anchoring transpeptidase ErfK/SrfK